MISTAVIEYEVRDADVLNMLTGMQRHSNDLTPVMKVIAAEVVRSTGVNFFAEGRPSRWRALSPAYYRRRARRGRVTILRVTEALMRSVTASAGNGWARVGSSGIKYAKIHQFGGTIRHPGAKKKGGGRGSAYGIVVPARPYLVIQADDPAKWGRALGNFIVSGAAQAEVK